MLGGSCAGTSRSRCEHDDVVGCTRAVRVDPQGVDRPVETLSARIQRPADIGFVRAHPRGDVPDGEAGLQKPAFRAHFRQDAVRQIVGTGRKRLGGLRMCAEC